MTAATPGRAAPASASQARRTAVQSGRDLRAEQDHAEFAGWFEAQGYRDGATFMEGDMADAFAAGMRAARDLDDAVIAAEVRAGHVRIETGAAAQGQAAVDPDCPVCAQVGGPHGVPQQPAPELAAAMELREAMAESRRYREALEGVRAIILEGASSTEGSRLRRSRAVIRAALEGK